VYVDDGDEGGVVQRVGWWKGEKRERGERRRERKVRELEFNSRENKSLQRSRADEWAEIAA